MSLKELGAESDVFLSSFPLELTKGMIQYMYCLGS